MFASTNILHLYLYLEVSILLTLTLIHLLHKIPLYVKYKRVATIILYLGIFALLFYMLYSNDSNMVIGETVQDTVSNPLFFAFYEIFVPGHYLSGWVTFGAWFALAAALVVYTFKGIIPTLYSDEGKAPGKRKRKKARKNKKESTLSYRSKGQVFLRYQLRQLQDTTFIMQLFFSKLYFPFIFLAPAIIGGDGISLAFLSELSHFLGLYMLIGFVFSLVIISETSVPGVIISFDKENYHYMKSLPMSFKEYMQYKYAFAYLSEWLMGAIILGIIAFFLKPPMSVFFSLLIGLTLGTYLMTMYYYMRDHRLLNLDWHNFTELMQRGINQYIRMILTFIIFLLALFGLFALSFWLFTQNSPMLTLGISALIAFLLLLTVFGMYTYANKTFWTHFER